MEFDQTDITTYIHGGFTPTRNQCKILIITCCIIIINVALIIYLCATGKPRRSIDDPVIVENLPDFTIRTQSKKSFE